MGHPSAVRLIPDCRVSVDGKKLDTEKDGALTRVEVDLDVDLFGQCVLVFNDPHQKLINGKDFASGVAVKVEIGFAAKLQKVFEGEVVALEPQFRRDSPPSLRVVCQESLHRLALSQMTRAFNDVDDKEIANQIATEHGLSADAPAGTKEHVLQGNVTDAVFLRRLAQKHGNHLRIEGKKLIIGPPPKGAELSIKPGDGLRKVKVKVQSQDQVEEISVHGYDPKTKQEFVGKAKGSGVTGEGTQKYGKGKTLSFAGHEHQPKDQATAEAMAKGRMRKLAEGHVTATLETIGDPGMLPGATLKLEKMGAQIDGSYRVEKALHHFSKHGYFATLKVVRTAKAAPPPPPPAAAPAPAPAAAPAPASAGGAPAPAPGAPPPTPPGGAHAHGTGGTAGTGGTGHAGTGGTGHAGTGGTGAGTGGTGHGTGGTAAAGTGGTAAPAAGTSIAFAFEPPTASCGDRVHVKATTENLADGTAVTIAFRARQGSSPRLATVNATVRGNRIDQEFQVANVDFGAGSGALTQVELEATSTNAATVTCAQPLRVQARSDAAAQRFDERRTWQDARPAAGTTARTFGGHPRFQQALERFRNKVDITVDAVKCWGVTYITPIWSPNGSEGGCWAGSRWARSTSPTDMTPNEYYDGAHWVPIPAPVRVDGTMFFSAAFYKDGSSFTTGQAGVRYPDAFTDYDFEAVTGAARRQWVDDVHSAWTDQFDLRRHGCPSDASVHCCRYTVEVHCTFHPTESHNADSILVGPGNYRSNMSTFFTGDSRRGTVPHEIGHLMDNPDEYQGGANDPSLNDDGADHGIDESTLMGSAINSIAAPPWPLKKRHFHAIALMLQRLVNAAYHNNDPYDVVPR